MKFDVGCKTALNTIGFFLFCLVDRHKYMVYSVFILIIQYFDSNNAGDF